MITGRAKRSIEDYFDRSFELEQLLEARGKDELHDMVVGISNLAEILYVRQREPLGLGHAVLCGEPFCRGEYFGVVLPDDVFVGQDGGLELRHRPRRGGPGAQALRGAGRVQVVRGFDCLLYAMWFCVALSKHLFYVIL